jgi:hypothetical protein
MPLSENRLSEIVSDLSDDYTTDEVLQNSFKIILIYLLENTDRLSWRGTPPDLQTESGIITLCTKYFNAYRKSDFPALPATVPDQMVSIVMHTAYGYSLTDCENIKLTHQQSMCAENAVGALLERYIDSVLRNYGWHWCCGSFVKAIDFIKLSDNGDWHELQIKNRDNSENSSSSAIRNNTNIQKWFRTKSRTGETNWNNLPPLMQGHGLSEEGFKAFVEQYLRNNR